MNGNDWHLHVTAREYASPKGSDVYSRSQPFLDWIEAGTEAETFQFCRSLLGPPSKEVKVKAPNGKVIEALNFASQDYLGLCDDPSVREAGAEALKKWGTHSAGSEPMGGALEAGRELEADLADFLGFEHIVLFPTGWSAGFGALRGLIRDHDQVLLDSLAHNCLQEGARASTSYSSFFAHNDMASLKKRLERVSSKKGDGAIFTVTESLFSMDSDYPDFEKFISASKAVNAFTFVDIAHDLGVLGPNGRGVLHEVNAAKDIDCVIGSFSKVFAGVGGFVGVRSLALEKYLRAFSGSFSFSNYSTPAQIAVAKRSLDVVRSQYGQLLRQRTLSNAAHLREQLTRRGLEIMGVKSPIVMVYVGHEAVARTAYKNCVEEGLLVNCIEYSACRVGQARFRLQLRPQHTKEDTNFAAITIQKAVAAAEDQTGIQRSSLA